MASGRIKGITIEIGGDTTKLDKALRSTDTNLGRLQRDLKAVDAALKLDPGNLDLLAQKERILGESMAETKSRVDILNEALDSLKKDFNDGKISVEQYKDQVSRVTLELDLAKSSLESTRNALSDASKAFEDAEMKAVYGEDALSDFGGAADDAAGELGKVGDSSGGVVGWLKRVAGISNDAASGLDDVGSSAGDASGGLGGLGSAAGGASGGLNGLTGASGGLSGGLSGLAGVAGGAAIAIGQKLVEAAIAAVEWMWNLDEATEEYREAMGKLNTAYEAAGFNAETAREAYEGFYKILGDTDTATEASQLLAQLVDSEEDVAEWTKIAAGVYGTFGDSLPIEGLIEAANETAKVGEVTGVLADALNWIGMSEDEFNEALANTADEGDRVRMIMETLSASYDEAADAFARNNQTLIETRENQMQLDAVQGELGESVAKLKNELFDLFGPFIIGALQSVTGLMEGIVWIFERLNEVVDFVVESVSRLIDFLGELANQSGILSGIGSAVGGVMDFLGGGKSSARSMAAPYALRTATPENIPYLARGTVTRPNNPFMAVVGDNPTEPEIISPYSTIKQAALDALSEGNRGSSTPKSVNVTLVLNGAVLGRAVAPLVDNYSSLRGVDLTVK